MTTPSKMKYNTLGNTGLKVSELCLGAMTFGSGFGGTMPSSQDDEAFEILNTFVAHGGNFIDTADAYTGSEAVVGRWLKTLDAGRDSVVIATKGFFPTGRGPNDSGTSRKHLVAALEASLERLDTPYVDLYQMHSWDGRTPLKETLITLHDFVRAGKVRYIGASNYCGWQLQKAIDLSNHLGLEIFSSLQQQYSLLERGIEWELVDVCKNEGVGILPWSPLKGGWLTGRYTRDSVKAEEGSRVEWSQKVGWAETDYANLATEHTFGVIDQLSALSSELDQPIPAIALRWLMQKPGVTAPIIGARTMKHLEANLKALEFELSVEQMKRLDDKSALPKPYPYRLAGAF